MDKITVETMLQSGHASVAHLADHFKVTIAAVEQFFDENKIPAPTARDPQYHYLQKLQAASRPGVLDWEALVFDDSEKRWINGIDTLALEIAPEGHIVPPDPDAIARRFHGEELHCTYTNAVTDIVMLLDGSRNNVLITNLVPITKEAIAERFSNAPLFIMDREYGFEDPVGHKVQVVLSLTLRLDVTFGAALKDQYLDGLVDQWLAPYLNRFSIKEILRDLPPTPELLSLWIWRHLSTVALLKGLAKVEVKRDGVVAVVTKDSYLQMTAGMITRAAQSRAIASRPSGIVSPQQAAREGIIPRGPLGKIIP